METEWKNELQQLILSLKNKEEVELFLETFLTPTEYDELSKRWQIIKQLHEELPQRSIRDDLRVSIATVTRGSREWRLHEKFLYKLCKRFPH